MMPKGGQAGCEDGGKVLGGGRVGEKDGAAELVGGVEGSDSAECA